jgi:diguanylate cyclase (GGDEF)-like protein
LSETGIEPLVSEGVRTPALDPILYARPAEFPARFPAVAEPVPPAGDESNDIATALRRLEHCLGLQTRAVEQLEGAAFNPAKVIALLKDAIQQERELFHDLHALQERIGRMLRERDHLAEALQQAEALSITDDLTGLPNRRAFVQRLEQEISRSLRTGQPLTVALLDMDNFKDINDRFGHHTGDRVLHRFAQRIVREFRQHDLSARYGGEEFVLLFPVTWQDEARNALEKLRHQIRGETMEVGGTGIGMPTFSAGIAGYRAGESAEALINRADQALYRAKRLGRNRTESDEPLPDRPKF